MTPVTITLLNFCVRRDTKTILHRINVPLVEDDGGALIGLVGPNGAGKSTLLEVLAGVLNPSAGGVFLGPGEKNLMDLPVHERAQIISYLPQTRPLYWAMRVVDVVRLGRYAFGGNLAETTSRADEAVSEAIKQVGLTGFEERSVHQLSGGEQARVHLARALAARTPILLADEPIAALDPAFQFDVMKILKSRAREGRHVVAALHDLRLAAQFCNRIIMIDQGTIVAHGMPSDVLTPPRLEEVFRISGQWTDGRLDLSAL